jgi:formylglycine-generating enzyme required for sulfatase activity
MSRPPSSDKSSNLAATTSALSDTAALQPGASLSGGATSGRLRLEPGTEPVPGYTLVQFLGRGGFGEVWKATGPGGFAVALKFIPLGDTAGAIELRALALMKEVRHPHLLSQFGSWECAGVLIVAMELADRTLLDRLREAIGQQLPGIPADELREYLREAAKGLDYLHSVGVQHRDVKPRNLLLVGGSIKVADFGLAKLLEHSRAAHTGAMTPAYAAPEFLKGEINAHSDQYALAVTYCELRGGRLPFTGDQAQILTGHLMEPPDLTMLPEAERPAVARALAKKPEDRWPSCRAFAEAVPEGRLDGTVEPGEEYINSVGMKLVRIGPGTFTMGSPEGEAGRLDHEGPQHAVELTRLFYLGVYPVTQEEYEKVTGKNPSGFSRGGRAKDEVQGLDTQRFPVENASWHDAVAFCEALNKKDLKLPAGWSYGLPTEAEWEYACRAGTTIAYSFGDDPKDLGDHAWFWDNADERTHRAGTRKPNPWGLFDMHGNVWQWCADRYGPYGHGSDAVRQGADAGELRVLRGGSWYDDPRYCRSANRLGNAPGVRSERFGFRVVLRPPAGTT